MVDLGFFIESCFFVNTTTMKGEPESDRFIYTWAKGPNKNMQIQENFNVCLAKEQSYFIIVVIGKTAIKQKCGLFNKLFYR